MVEILLAVYNGEKYLSKQLDSILNQSYNDWHLVIQDDCSSDNTENIAKQYVSKYHDKIEFRKNKINSGRASLNFFAMLSKSNADYAMTCDQDDFWLPDKIQLTIDKMKELESKSNLNTPILVHTDLRPVDSELNVITNSMFKSQNLDFRRDSLNYLLAQNIITGCTMMVNKPLLDLCRAVPHNAIMHDWWCGLAASAFGEIGFIEKQTILYRQHSANQVGAKDAKSAVYIMKRAGQGKSNKQVVLDTYSQAESFAAFYKGALEGKKIELVQAYAAIPSKSKLLRIATLFKYRFWKYGLVRKIGQLIYS